MENKLIHLTNELDLHISMVDFFETLEKCHEYGKVIVQDKQGQSYKIHSVQEDDNLNTILMIVPEYNPDEDEDDDWEE